MDFNCKQCGLCCSRIGIGIENAKQAVKDGHEDKIITDLANFPYKYNDTGRCENLGEDNLCKIYETRPDICRMNKTYENYFRDQMTQSEYYEWNESMCDEAIEKNKQQDLCLN